MRIILTSPNYDRAVLKSKDGYFMLTVYKGLHEEPLNSRELERLSGFGYQPSSAMFESTEAALDYLNSRYKKHCEQRNMPEWLSALPDWLHGRYKN